MADPNPPPAAAPKKPTSHLWIILNTDGPIGFPMPAVKNAITKETTADPSPLRLLPGANLVERKKWEALKAAEVTAAAAAEKLGIDVVQGEIARMLTAKIPKGTHKNRQPENAGKVHIVEGPAVASKAAPLDGIPEAEAIAVVQEITALDVLRPLLQIEKRPAVNEALHRVRDELGRGLSGAA